MSGWNDMPKNRMRIPLNREVIQSRIAYIEDSIKSLERFKGASFEEFHSNSDHFRIAFYDLHRALEAVMDIGSHILSRIPGARPSSYKDIPKLLEKHKMIPIDFASNQLTKMAGYRN
ncbi:MAG: type VII toxin-antitoxin system HepT family RNase toxin, partial [Thermodesulfobacteriota bacterium]